MIILVDSREHEGKNEHVLEYFRRNGICYVNAERFGNVALSEGDYMNAERSDITLDRKAGLAEVYCNVVTDCKRFLNECVRARQNGKRLIVLVEEDGIKTIDDVEHWLNPRYLKWVKLHQRHKLGKSLGIQQPEMPPITSAELCRRMKSFSHRYGVEWQFCARQNCGERIAEILGENQ